MGCAQSRIENEEAVARCKDRRQFMKQAVAARNFFAAAHSAYAMSLRDTGAALSEFAHGEGVPQQQALPSAAAEAGAGRLALGGAGAAVSGVVGPSSAAVDAMVPPPPPPLESLPPPPPPLPEFSPSPAKIHRSKSMPMPPKVATKGRAVHHSDSIREEEEVEMEEEEEEVEDDDGHLDDRRRRLRRHAAPQPVSPVAPETPVTPQPPPPPPPLPPHPLDPKPGIDTWDYFFAMEDGMTSMPAEDDEIVAEPEDEKYVPASPPRPPSSPPRPVAAPPPEEFEEEPRTPEMVTPPASLPPKPPGLSSKKKKGKGKGKGKHKAAHHQHTESAPVVTAVPWGKAGRVVPAEMPRVDLLRVLAEIDDRFLKASESAGEVSMALEANRMHYHSNFAVDPEKKGGHIDHSARVMKIITWNRSFTGLQNGDEGKDDFENDPSETLATVIDKILAWEKKLYDEVKAGEIMKLEYQRKVALLNRQKKNNASVEVLEKTKAAVTHLHTRYIVDMQSMDSTVSEIQHLRDHQLYPKLLELAESMAKMWEEMHKHHGDQLQTVSNLKSVDISDSNIETSTHHHSHTRQLRDIVEKWNTNFNDLMNYQKEYINALYSWLKLNLVPIESSLKEKVASPPRMQQPPVKNLLQTWNEQLVKLPDDLAKHAIVSFRAVLDTILSVQDDELKQKEACDQIQKEYMRKARAFEDWYHKHSQRKSFDVDPESDEGTSQKDAISERKFAVESLKRKLDDEVEAHNKLAKQVREKSLSILKAHLPELFRALSDFSHACSAMHSELSTKTPMQDQGNN